MLLARLGNGGRAGGSWKDTTPWWRCCFAARYACALHSAQLAHGVARPCLPRLQSNEALRGEIEALRGAPSPLAAARDAKAETLADKEKFVKLLDNLAAHKASLQRKLAERQADVAAQGAELAAVEAENEGLRGRIAVQTVHPQDVMRMNQDK